jgi:hypothetical protein
MTIAFDIRQCVEQVEHTAAFRDYRAIARDMFSYRSARARIGSKRRGVKLGVAAGQVERIDMGGYGLIR